MSDNEIDGAPEAADQAADEADRASRRWRSLWRVHFYAGIFSFPILLLLAVTGLAILYTQPINDFVDGDVRTVSVQGEPLGYDAQADAVRAEFPDEDVVSVVTPVDDHHSTAFGLSNGRDAYVDPYTGEVLGTLDPDGGVIGLANRLHGFLNNEQVMVPMPNATGIFGEGPAFADVPLGDLIVEIFACWALVLAISGVYLWWPRKKGTGKALFLPRVGAKGRARWRDLHAIPGVIFSGILLFIVASGLPWSGFWGSSFSYAAEELSPGSYPEQPASSVATLGDLDRFGNRINWALQDTQTPASEAPAGDGGEHEGHGGGGTAGGDGIDPDTELPARLSIDSIVRAGFEEGMNPGYAISFPEDVTNDDGTLLFGSYTAANPWPAQSQDARTLYFDQFTGETLGGQYLYGFGSVWKAADYTISTHMGTQFGVANRIVMTGAALGVIWAVLSAGVMYTKRRRKGTAGLPRRPVDVRLASRLVFILILLAVVFPLWGASAFLVLAADNYVIRKLPRLRVTFGQQPRLT